MAHLKRQKVPKNWQVKRKGSTYVVRPNFNISKGIPILVVLRDILKIGENRREIKKIIHQKKVQHNGKSVKDEKNSVLLFDTISLIPPRKHYRLELSEKRKFKVKEINEEESERKTAKIIGKKILKGKKNQLNLSDGRNFISDIKCNINDSVLIDLKNKKIIKCLPLKEKAKIIVFEGKHAGEVGVIKKIVPENKLVEVEIKDNKVSILIKQLMVIEENGRK